MTKPLFHSQKVFLRRCTKEQRWNLASKLYHEIFSQMWAGVSLEAFYSYFFEGDFPQQVIYLYYNKQKLVGYLMFRVIHTKVQSIRFGIPRISANILPEYMGYKLTTIPVFKECVLYFVRSFLNRRKMVLFFTANTPTSYVAMHNRTRLIYPSPYRHTPPIMRKLISQIGEILHLEMTSQDPHTCLYTNVRVKTDLKQRIDESEGDVAAFYRRHCPNFAEGGALLTIMPVSLLSGFAEIANQLKNLSKAFWKQRMPSTSPVKKPSKAGSN